MIFYHYLIVQTWTHAFVSPTKTIDKTMVWIRFPGHNFYFYDESILLALSFAVGSPVKVDVKALDARRGSFSRVCVEVELKKLVVGRVGLKDH